MPFGSSSSSGGKVLRWKEHGKNRDIDPSEARLLATKKYKARADLVAFASKHPGALAAGFLVTVFEKLKNRLPSETRHLWEASGRNLPA